MAAASGKEGQGLSGVCVELGVLFSEGQTVLATLA